MTVRKPIVKRLLGFEAGPQNHTFYACEEHRGELERGDVMCFFALKNHPVETLSEDEQDSFDCDLCREG